MTATWPVLTMILVNWIICPAIGLKCYVCDSGMEDCRTISSKSIQYLKDCGSKAISCATLTVENKGFSNTKGRWFQRICFFKDDEFAFSFNLDYYEMIYDELSFKRTLNYAISFRSQQSLPPIANNLPKTSPLRRFKTNLIKVHSCWWTQVKDGCNDWEATPIFPLAEGYPMQEYRQFNKLYGNLSCYFCSKGEYYKSCHLYKNSTKVRSHYGRFGSGGCAILSIHMNNKSSLGNYVERDLWHPGDSWCLNRGFDSSPSGKSVIRYFIPEGNEGSCRTRVMLQALKQNSSLEYTCSGKRVFYSVKELNEFKRCRRHVRARMGFDVFGAVAPFMDPDYMFKDKTEQEQSFKDEGQPYAIVYFKFCGGKSACNFEAESELVDELDDSIPEISNKLFTRQAKSLEGV